MQDFSGLNIKEQFISILKENGITEPTPVQLQAIPALLAGRDVSVQAQTGTGKTMAFILPLLQQLEVKKTYVQGLIITPTRELALQITIEVKKLATVAGLNVLAVYGGQDVEQQVKKLAGNIHLIVGTPGRLLDHMRRGTVILSGVTRLVLDEADQMLHMGFLDDVEELIRHTSAKRQTMLFSATMPLQVKTLAKRFMHSPVHIQVASERVTLDEIKQTVIRIAEQDKLDKLCGLVDEYRPYLAIIFCHTKQRAIEVGEALAVRGYQVDELHGDLSQTKREQVLKRFREAKLQILVATDIAARGLDIEGVTHIFNYDIPHDVASYIHRIGRTGRAGETGEAITFVTPEEQEYLRLIERGTGQSFGKPAGGKKLLPRREKKDPGVPFGSKQKKQAEKREHSGVNLRSRRKKTNLS